MICLQVGGMTVKIGINGYAVSLSLSLTHSLCDKIGINGNALSLSLSLSLFNLSYVCETLLVTEC